MTEQEALKKWCPFSRVANAGRDKDSGRIATFVVFNRSTDVGDVPLNSMCIGPACMAWRWEKTAQGSSHTDGFCGLAGYP